MNRIRRLSYPLVSGMFVWEIDPNLPDRRQPRDHESPPSRPRREILCLSKYEMRGIAMLHANRQGNDSGKDEDEVHDDEHGLQFAHDSGERTSHQAMAGNCADENSVDFAIRWCPITITGNDDDGEEH